MTRLAPGVDPGERDPGHWERLRLRTEALAAPELARRRGASRGSVSAMMTAWSQAIIPVAAALAAVAVLLLLSETGAAAGGGARDVAPTPRAATETAPDATAATLDGGDRLPVLLQPDGDVVSFAAADEEF